MAKRQTKQRLATESPTGKGWVETASKSALSTSAVADEDSFDKPVFISENDEHKGSIHVTSNEGVSLIKPIKDVIFSQIDWGASENVYRAKVQNGLSLTFMGKNPVPVNLQITLYNAKNESWRDTFQWYFENYLRGTALAKLNALAYLVIDGMIFGGAFTSVRYIQQGSTPLSVSAIVTIEMDPNYIRPLYLNTDPKIYPDNEVPTQIRGIRRSITDSILKNNNAGGIFAVRTVDSSGSESTV